MAWLTSKVRIFHDSKRSHLVDLKDKVLRPMIVGLDGPLKPLAHSTTLPVEHVMGYKEPHLDASVTEVPQLWGASIRAVNPFNKIESEIDDILFEDCAHHFPEVIECWNAFRAEWQEYANDCEVWASKIARQILAASNLPPYGNNLPLSPFLMEYPLVLFVLMRYFDIPTDTVRKERSGNHWSLIYRGENALGTEIQIDAVIDCLQNLIRELETNTFTRIRQRQQKIQADFDVLSRKTRYAVANQKLYGKCKLVSFW